MVNYCAEIPSSRLSLARVCCVFLRIGSLPPKIIVRYKHFFREHLETLAKLAKCAYLDLWFAHKSKGL